MDVNDQIVLYKTPDGHTELEVRLQEETMWLTQKQIAELFDTDRTVIVRHIHNIYKTEELEEMATCAKIAQVRQEGKRTITRELPFYNLDMILSVGYRGTQKMRLHSVAGQIVSSKITCSRAMPSTAISNCSTTPN